MMVQTWTDVVASSLQNLWYGFAAFVPNLIGAIIVLIIVYAVIGAILSMIVLGIFGLSAATSAATGM